ncbi:dTDP-4-dehydrorhamnose reductase [Paenibacillus sp. YIM B09110]|uniref:dTDP-4-dehydrorhamnose reductase n=1 Tax=Paenibacillus sp. YIM B09110 TaxID=3126102 RepID=UPI00301BE6D5
MTIPKLKILVTGANGQLGRELALWTTDAADIIGFSREDLDITSSEQCKTILKRFKPDVVIHCAAYTAVDKAESEPDAAFLVNEAGTRILAEATAAMDAKLCYISTDYVFDGTSSSPYEEQDQPNPQTVYGKSKLAGEVAVQSVLERYFIVRTSWVFGNYGNNFVKTMLNLAGERDHLTVVTDQVGSPTYTYDLASFLIELVQTEHYGIYHASNTGSCSWFEFAEAIFEESKQKVKLEPCTTAEFPRPAPRPANSVMAHGAILANGLQDLRSWREALKHFIMNET